MRFFTLAVLIFTAHLLFAQSYEQCGTMYADSMLRSRVANAPSLIDFENWLQQKMNEPATFLAQRGGIITIPVIVHVVHNGDAVGTGQNLSQAQVMSQFDVLNEDFRRLNADAVNTPSAFLPVAADVEIEFCPAVVDPNGNLLAEPGINRVNIPQTTWSQSDIDINLKPSTIWDPTRYFNIWTVAFSSSSLLGYAQFPEGSGLAGMPTGTQSAETDGIVCRYDAFGRTGNVTAPYNQGRTATHEAGHWLGLRHIWGDGDCSADDYCTDTPPSDDSNNGCQTGYISCGGVNMVQNYMDYSNDACMNIFTLCQKTRMQTVMQNSPRRVELLSSTVCIVLDQYTVSGQVRDGQSLQGVPFAKVRFKNSSYDYQANCDANGNFTINNIFEGTYTVYGGQWGHITGTLTANVDAGMAPVVITVNRGYYDDFVLDFAWTVTGSASSGIWERAQPAGTTFNGAAANPGADVTNDLGTECFVTGNAGGAAGNDDVDNGNTVLTSPVFDLSNYSDPYLKFYRWFYNGGGTGTPNDQLVLRISNGNATATIETVVYNTPNANQWNFRNIRISDYVPLSANMQFALETNDLSSTGHLVEAGLDFFSITDSVSTPTADMMPDVTLGCADLYVSFSDISAGNPTAWQWTFPGGIPATSTDQHPTVIYSTPGYYSVTLTATNAAGSNTLTISDLITVYANPDVTGITSDNVSCFNAANGSAMLTVSGGTPPYSAFWSDGGTGLSRNDFPVGSYYAIVADQNGCTDSSATINITQPAALDITVASTPEYCNTANGTATVTTSGGVPPYIAQWNAANGFTITNLASGQYIVTVTDAKSCFATDTVIVSANNNTPVLTLTATNVSCFGGSDGAIATSVAGGTSPYDFIWSTGADSANLSALVAGNYTLTVTDANGCETVQTRPVTEPAVLVIADSVVNSSCGLNNGSITLAVSEGVPPYTYLWDDGSTGITRASIGAGDYSVTVTDNNQCIFSKTIQVAQSSSLSISALATNTTCGLPNGAVSAAVSGGMLPYSYLWNNGDTLPSQLNLAARNYTITVTDASGCTASQMLTVAASAAPVIHDAVLPTTCGAQNGSITLTVTNGTAPYMYLWDNGSDTAALHDLAAGDYTVTVTDDAGCASINTSAVAPSVPVTFTGAVLQPRCGVDNGSLMISTSGMNYTFLWNTGDTTFSLSNIATGTYTVTVTDAEACTAQESFTLVAEPPVTIQLHATEASCYGAGDGSITATVTSGTAPFIFDWSTGDSDSTLIAGAGAYAVLVTDSAGCVAVANAVINEPALLTLDVLADDLVCTDKVVLATPVITGGTAPYTMLWDNQWNTDSINLLNGIHTALVTDANGCTARDTFTVDALPEPQYTLQATADTANRSTGTATVTITAGTPPYSFVWSNADSDSVATGLSAGAHSVTITDGNGCEVEDTVVIQATVNVVQMGTLVLSIYPNPNDGVFQIHADHYTSTLRAEVYNAIGQRVFSVEKLADTLTTIDVRAHGKGVYLVRIFADNAVVTRKMVYGE